MLNRILWILDPSKVLVAGGLLIPLVYLEFPKWLAFFGLAIFFAAALIAESRFNLTTLTLTFLFAGIITVRALNDFHPILLQRIAMCFVFLAAAQAHRKNPDFLHKFTVAVIASTGVIGLWSLLQLGRGLIEQSFGGLPDFSASFGNPNLAGEWIAIGFVFTAQLLSRQSRPLWICVAAFQLLLLLLYGSRTALIASGIGGSVILLPRFKTLWTVLVIGLIAGVGIRSHFQERFQSTKMLTAFNKSFAERIEIATETLELIARHPLGVGTGRYGFASLETLQQGRFFIKENEILRSPHNDYLRLISEEGLVGGLSLIFICMALLLAAAKNSSRDERKFILGFALFWMIESFFQFPLENPASVFVFSVLLGMGGRVTYPTKRAWGSLGMIFAGILIALTLRIFQPPLTELSCQQNPYNWRLCMNVAAQLIDEGQLDRAKSILTSQLKREPYLFPAIRQWANIANREGDLFQECLALWIDNNILPRRNSLRTRMIEHCPEKTTRWKYQYFKRRGWPVEGSWLIHFPSRSDVDLVPK